jgi:tetratricopeptide (TPR) repeat protein
MGYGGLGFLPFGSGFGGLGYGLGFGGLGYGLGGLGYGRYGGYGGGGYGGYGGYGGGGYGGYGGYGGGYGYPSGGYADSTAPVADDGQQDYVALGEQDFRAGRYNEAVRDWQHALLDDPQNGGLMMLLGQALFATGHFEEAAGATQLGMQLLPQNQWGAVVSNFHELYQGNAYTTQLRALEDSIRSEDSPAKRFLLGYHYAYLGHTADAVRQLDKAVQLNPKDKMAAQLRDLMAGKGGSASATETPELAPAR